MFAADGGGGFAPVESAYAGTQTLRIEPSAIPEALAAFRAAFAQVSEKVTALNGLEVPSWADDPISDEAAMLFVERTNGGGADSASKCLHGYQQQLQAVISALESAQAAYTLTEGTNSAMWGKSPKA